MLQVMHQGGLVTDSQVDNSGLRQVGAGWAVSGSAGRVIDKTRVSGSFDSVEEAFVVVGPDREVTVSW